MKQALAFLALVGAADAAVIVGEYGDGNVMDETIYSTVVGGDMNSAIGSYSTIGGGYANVAHGDYSTIAGGQSNTVISNYGSIMGGYANFVTGRFGVVLGGSKNTAAGRHSAALGFSAVASGDYSMTACFTGDECVNDQPNTIAFYADNMYLNDFNLNDLISTGRRLSEESASDSLNKAEEALEKYTADYNSMMKEVDAALAHQDSLLSSMATKLH